MGIGDVFIVNRMMFCEDHGREFCNTCFCDHRPCNNIILELDNEIQKILKKRVIGIDDRPPLNAHALGAVIANKEQETYKCVTHGTVDCGDCFDWLKLILASVGIQVASDKPTAGRSTQIRVTNKKKPDVNDVD